MKSLKILPLFILSVGLFLSSCKKEAEDRIPGDWTATITSTETDMPAGGTASTESETGTGTAKFNEDGTGTITVWGETVSLTWSATEENVTLTIDGDILILEIVENEKNTQEWKMTETESDGNGGTYEYTLVIKLTK